VGSYRIQHNPTLLNTALLYELGPIAIKLCSTPFIIIHHLVLNGAEFRLAKDQNQMDST